MNDAMNLDIRLPIGLLFTVLAILLVAQGVVAGVRVDIAWGAVMAAFGLAMLALAWRARRR